MMRKLLVGMLRWLRLKSACITVQVRVHIRIHTYNLILVANGIKSEH